MLIGEGPGADEDQAGTPFVGGAGRILGRWLYEAGVFRGEVRVDNVFSHRPPGNELATAKPDYYSAHAALDQRINIVNPRVIVALGETALNFFGHSGITNWRGSCFEWKGRRVVATLHPAFIMRQQGMWRFCVEDMRFALRHAATHSMPKPTYTINPSPQWLEEWCREIPPEEEVSLDLETTMDMGTITQVSLAWRPHEAVCFDMEEEYLTTLLRLLHRPIRWVGQNIIMFDSLRLAELGAPLITVFADLMLAHHLLESPAPHDLGFINGCLVRDPFYKNEIVSNRHVYACKDADVTLRCWHVAKQRLQTEGMRDLFQVVMKVAHYVRAMHLRGVPVDKSLVAEEAKKLGKEAEEVLTKIRDVTGNKWFNPRSFKDCQEALYAKLKLPVQYNRKGRERKVTTDDDALVKLGKQHPLPGLILQYRRPANDLSKYFRVETIKDGRWYVDWRIHGTETGRYAAWFHTIPPRARYVVRQDGKKIAYVDAQQGEFRVAAWCSDDRAAKDVCEAPGGVHVANSCLLFKCKPADVTPMRKFYSKFTTYGWLYGRQAESIEEQYGVPRKHAQEIIDALNDTYRRIVIWKAETASLALRQGWLKNPYGRKRYFAEGSDGDKEREAYAFIPQSTLHDITQRAHILVEENIPTTEVEVVADMHDALLLVVAPIFDPTSLVSMVSREYLSGLVMPFDYDVHNWWHDKRAEEDARGKVIVQ